MGARYGLSSTTEVLMTGIGTMCLGIGILAATSMGVLGCKADIRDYCEKEVKCSGGNDKDEDACREMMKASRRAAKEYDCRNPWDAVLECFVNNMTCEEDLLTDNGECIEKQTKLSTCIDKSSGYDNGYLDFYDQYYDAYYNDYQEGYSYDDYFN